jgi:imidazoleglycerol-phosphate dehydratase
MRSSQLRRSTAETEVSVKVEIDGTGKCSCDTSMKFLNHMIASFSTHSLIDITVSARGDLRHHIVEDVAICLGKTIDQALGKRSGIRRFGDAIVPMDEALSMASVDLVRRSHSHVELGLKRHAIEDVASEDLVHFFDSLITNINCTAYVRVLQGDNDHHRVESSFKAFAVAFREASEIDERREGNIPSSKGEV